MKQFLKHLSVAVVILIAALALGSCAKQGDTTRQRRQKFQVISLDKVKGSLSEGWRVTLTVANNTGSNMRITSANAFVRYNGRKIGRIVVDEEVVLPRRRCAQVEVPLRITLSNPITALSLFNKVRKGDFSGIAVDYSVTVAAFASHRVFERENVSLDELAAQFNFGLKK